MEMFEMIRHVCVLLDAVTQSHGKQCQKVRGVLNADAFIIQTLDKQTRVLFRWKGGKGGGGSFMCFKVKTMFTFLHGSPGDP